MAAEEQRQPYTLMLTADQQGEEARTRPRNCAGLSCAVVGVGGKQWKRPTYSLHAGIRNMSGLRYGRVRGAEH
jgi:hypothetical protein